MSKQGEALKAAGSGGGRLGRWMLITIKYTKHTRKVRIR